MRASLVLGGLLFLALLATPALASPEGSDTADLDKQIQQLTKELKKLEKRLEQARAGRGRPADEQDMAAARRRLAGLLAERGQPGQPPQPPQPPRPPRGPRARGPGGPGATDRAGPDQGPQWASVLRRLHQENRRLAARVERLEQQVRRLGAAVGNLAGGDAKPRGGKAERARKERGKRGRGDRRGMRGRGPGAFPAWSEMARGPGLGGGRGMGPGMGRGDGMGAGRARAAQGRMGRPGWMRMLRGMRMHRPDGLGPGPMPRGPGRSPGACPFCGS